MASSFETQATPSEARDAHSYYNNPQEHGLQRRNESKILYMRNFNNWIKSTLINEYLQLIRNEDSERKDRIHVFDMGCGKGGDQLKWDIGHVNRVTFSDLAEKSVDVCKQRYHTRKSCYSAEFFPLNCTTELLRDKFEEKKPCFDLVSTQFVLHYAFDKLESANQFLRNAAEFLRIGGYFIGTTVNSCHERCRQTPNQSISNDVFSINFDPSINLKTTDNESIPLFGAKYHFSLDEVVDCPEYLVYFPLLEKLAEKHGLERVDRQTFKDYFDKHSANGDGRSLLRTMKALERYGLTSSNSEEQSNNDSQYAHAKRYIDNANMEHQADSIKYCRTLSQQEWDMTRLYIMFAFKKVRHVNYDEDTITNA
ncbi:unnamed protein product [Adineta steineri]|uniref:mRNA cap guanine-N(7) methyltransferase n=1 Tax=Adineta steineri TaxID=433720 RepID=A0A814ZFU7_9BILA|nr:unnamed protein product [Adineta steineri]CAF1383016.1 unnamed protein product [Adineta steineri]